MNFFIAATAMLAFVAHHVSAQSIAAIVVGSEIHETLEAAVLAAPAAILELLSDENQDLTLFAPDDTAFAALGEAVGADYVADLLTPAWFKHLTCVLASHVVDGAVPSSAITGPLTATSLFGTELAIDNVDGTVSVNGSPVTIPDIVASNGIVHSISGLPILPTCVTQSIVDIASSLENFSTLVSLVVAADLVDALATTRPLTVLAPTNEAFAAVPEGVLAYLAGNVTALTEVLLYHVVPEIKYLGDENSSGGSFTTLQGEDVTIMKDEMTMDFEVNGHVDFVGLDVLASNGVIHVIDSVLLPPMFSIPAPAPAPPMAAPVLPPTGFHPVGSMGSSSSSSSSSSKKSKSGKSKKGRKSGGKHALRH